MPEAETISAPLWGSARFSYVICAFLAIGCHVFLRNTLNFVILCMVKPESPDNTTISASIKNDVRCPRNSDHYHDLAVLRAGDLEWTRAESIDLVGTYYYGFLVALPIAGRLADRWGGKIFFVHSITGQAVVHMTIPFFARISYMAAKYARIVQGVIGGIGNPAIYQLFCVWSHSSERTAFISISSAGISLGSLVVFPISSWLCDFGWEWPFYLVGGVSLVFGLCCQCLVYSNLEDHPRISPIEFEYLKSSRVPKSTTRIPWHALLTSVTVYAMILTHFFQCYSLMAVILLIPRFFKEAMKMNLDEVGIWSSAPYVGSLLSKFISVSSCSFLERRNKDHLTRFRRIVYVGCNILTALFLYGVTILDCTQRQWVLLLTVCIGLTADIAYISAFWPSLLYMAPTCAGLMSGIANFFGTISGFIAPVIIAQLVVEETKEEWNKVMISLLIAYLLAGLIFGLFGARKVELESRPSITDTSAHRSHTS